MNAAHVVEGYSVLRDIPFLRWRQEDIALVWKFRRNLRVTANEGSTEEQAEQLSPGVFGTATTLFAAIAGLARVSHFFGF